MLANMETGNISKNKEMVKVVLTREEVAALHILEEYKNQLHRLEEYKNQIVAYRESLIEEEDGGQIIIEPKKFFVDRCKHIIHQQIDARISNYDLPIETPIAVLLPVYLVENYRSLETAASDLNNRNNPDNIDELNSRDESDNRDESDDNRRVSYDLFTPQEIDAAFKSYQADLGHTITLDWGALPDNIGLGSLRCFYSGEGGFACLNSRGRPLPYMRKFNVEVY